MIKRILYAADLGLYGPYLMKKIGELAFSSQAKVDVLHVVEPMGVFAESIINTYISEKERDYLRNQGVEEVLSRIRAQVIDALDADYSLGNENVSLGEVLVELGDPAETIIQQAITRKADLIAIGSHGEQAYRGRIIGSVVAKVLQVSTVPVYMIPMVSLNDLGRSQ